MRISCTPHAAITYENEIQIGDQILDFETITSARIPRIYTMRTAPESYHIHRVRLSNIWSQYLGGGGGGGAACFETFGGNISESAESKRCRPPFL